MAYQPDVPEISTLNLIDWIGLYKGKAIDFYSMRPVSDLPREQVG
jgi:hypothetical protein